MDEDIGLSNVNFFGFEPTEFLDTLFHDIDKRLKDNIDSLALILHEKTKSEKKNDINQSLENLLEKIHASFGTYLDVFELYVLKNIFNIPTDITLVESSSRYSKNDEKIIDNQIEEMVKKVQIALYINQHFQGIISVLNDHLAHFSQIEPILSQITYCVSSPQFSQIIEISHKLEEEKIKLQNLMNSIDSSNLVSPLSMNEIFDHDQMNINSTIDNLTHLTKRI